MTSALYGGQLPMLDYIYDQNPNLRWVDQCNLGKASLNVLIWLKERGHKLKKNYVVSAIEAAHYDVARWLIEQGEPQDISIVDEHSLYVMIQFTKNVQESIEMLEYLKDRIPRMVAYFRYINPAIITYLHNSVEMFRWLVKNG